VALALLVQQLVESYNYGLYYPPANGRAGKFLDEERCMSEYPLQGSVGRLEVFNFTGILLAHPVLVGTALR